MNNYLHDWYYDAGFDEAARQRADEQLRPRRHRRRQHLRGGAGLLAARNNANMSTPCGRPAPAHAHVPVDRRRIALAQGATRRPRSAGAKQAGTADFGAQAFDLTARPGARARTPRTPTGPTTTDGCTAFTNAGAVAGRIAVVDRGVCTVRRQGEERAGRGRAPASLIVNNVAPGARRAWPAPTRRSRFPWCRSRSPTARRSRRSLAQPADGEPAHGAAAAA